MEHFMDWWVLTSPFIASGLTGFFGYIFYKSNKRVDRLEELKSQKAEYYARYLAAHTAHTFDTADSEDGSVDKAVFRELVEAASLVVLFGSNAVEEHMIDLLTDPKETSAQAQVTLRALAAEMRKDLHS